MLNSNGVNGGARAWPQEGKRADDPLCDPKLEATILGSCLIKPALINTVALDAEDFGSVTHQVLWRAMLELHSAGQLRGTFELRSYLADRGLLLAGGGEDYLRSLSDDYIPAPPLPYERIKRLALQRRLRQAAQAALSCHESPAQQGRHLDQLVELREALAALDRPEHDLLSFADYVEGLRYDGRRIRTGLVTLDEAFRGGVPTGRFGVLLGAPGAAKTTFSVWLADQWERAGAYVLYLAADEAADGVATRFGQLDGFPREGLESPHDTVRRAFAARLRTRPGLFLVDPAERKLTLEDGERILRERAKDKVRVLIVDSLQTIPCLLARDADTAKERIDAAVEVCKNAAKRGAIVLAISEMSRGAYRTGNRQTDTSVLASGKESGSIEYGGAFVLGLRSVANEKGVIEIEVAKNRLGSEKPLLRASLNYERASFRELEAVAPELDPAEKQATERLERARQRILETLSSHTDLTSMREVLAHTNGARDPNADALRDLLKRGGVVVVDGVFRPAVGGGQ